MKSKKFIIFIMKIFILGIIIVFIQKDALFSKEKKEDVLSSEKSKYSSEEIQELAMSVLKKKLERITVKKQSSSEVAESRSEEVSPLQNLQSQQISEEEKIEEKNKQEEAPEEVKYIDLDFSNANIEDVLRVIGEGAGLNIVVDPIIRGRKIDLHLKNVSVDEALSLVYKAYNLGYLKIGNTLFVSTEDKIKRSALITKVVKIKNVSAEIVKDLIKKLVESVECNKEINSLILIGTPAQIKKAEEIIAKIDVVQPQVVLASKVIEIDRNALSELGIDWSNAMHIFFQESKRPVETGTGALIAVEAPFKIFRLERTAAQLEAIIRMLEEKNKAWVLANPRITTMNNKEAEIFIGDRVPYTITTVTGGVANTEVRFTESGIRLKITPSVVEDDFVVVEVKPEVSYIYGWRGPNDEYPWIKTREATAYVRVKDGQTFVIGGLISKEDLKNIYKVPFLSNIPIFGRLLFTYEKKENKNTEIIITVTPKIVK